MIQDILYFLLSPIKWFWNRYENHKEEHNLLMVIADIIIAVFGLFIMGFMVFFIISRLVAWGEKHPYISIGVGIVAWLFIFVRKKESGQSKLSSEVVDTNALELEKTAQKGYASMRRIMFSALKSVVREGVTLEVNYLPEIEMPERHFSIINGVVMYMFKSEKRDYSITYDDKQLCDFSKSLQYEIDRLIENKTFPDLLFQNVIDTNGKVYSGVMIDHIIDMGRYFEIYTAFASDSYIKYRNNLDVQKMATYSKAGNGGESWSDN